MSKKTLKEWRSFFPIQELTPAEILTESLVMKVARSACIDIHTIIDLAESEISTLQEKLRKEIEAGITLETQNRIRELVIKKSGADDCAIDGSGCDSGDPVDLTLAEISQGFNVLIDEMADMQNRLRWIPVSESTELKNLQHYNVITKEGWFFGTRNISGKLVAIIPPGEIIPAYIIPIDLPTGEQESK